MARPGGALVRARSARVVLALVAGLVSASTVQAQVYTRRNSNGVVEATNVPASPGYNLTYPGKGTLIHSRGFQRTRAYWSMYDHHVQEAAQLHQVSPDLVKSIIAVESEFDQWAVSSKGARGLMQLMPDTRAWMIDRTPELWSETGKDDALSPESNVRVGVRYFAHLKKGFRRLDHVLQAYNCGPGRLVEILSGRAVLPEETKFYAQRVQRLHHILRADNLD